LINEHIELGIRSETTGSCYTISVDVGICLRDYLLWLQFKPRGLLRVNSW
jgi:hypothetical protein